MLSLLTGNLTTILTKMHRFKHILYHLTLSIKSNVPVTKYWDLCTKFFDITIFLSNWKVLEKRYKKTTKYSFENWFIMVLHITWNGCKTLCQVISSSLSCTNECVIIILELCTWLFYHIFSLKLVSKKVFKWI